MGLTEGLLKSGKVVFSIWWNESASNLTAIQIAVHCRVCSEELKASREKRRKKTRKGSKKLETSHGSDAGEEKEKIS